MQFRPNSSIVPYPDCFEKSKLAILEKLFSDWYQLFAKNDESLASKMVFDGFYPHYFSQEKNREKKRILFIGWEALGMTEDEDNNNYIEALYDCYRNSNLIGNRRLNNHRFHYRMICIAYGILHGMPDWNNFGEAETLIEDFAKSGGWSFAFMNISKLSNDSGKSAADWNLINTSFRLSTEGPEGRNFIEEEIAILEPHIVIAMNLKEKYKWLGTGLDWTHVSRGVNSSPLQSCGHPSLLIDSWHFSNWFLNDVTDYYVPIRDAIRRSKAVAAVEQPVANQI